MKSELQFKLFKKYPRIFKQRKLPITHSAMPWGVECGDGWYDLINNLCRDITWYIKTHNHIPPIEATQVKEKWGGLRFYFIGGDDNIQDMVDIAEKKSFKTCEDCGSQGDDVKTWAIGWNRTLCVKCAKEGEHPSYYTPLYYWYFYNVRNRWLHFKWRMGDLFRRIDERTKIVR